MGLKSGTIIGRYRILEQLGEGGMAIVYRAYDTSLDCEVAIKVIRRDAFGSAKRVEVMKRFQLEAHILAQLNHPYIVKVTDYDQYKGMPYLVMPFLSGGTLKDFIQQRAQAGGIFTPAEAGRLLAPVARALEYAHQRNVLHRDVKPANILLTDSGAPLLSDFGVARILDYEEKTLTATGVGIGTPEYMSPEQGQGNPVHASDQYALGVVLYELLTGRKPFIADTSLAVLLKHINDPLPPPNQFSPGISSQAEHILYTALAKKPEDRYPSMSDFALALEQLQIPAQSIAVSNDSTIIPSPHDISTPADRDRETNVSTPQQDPVNINQDESKIIHQPETKPPPARPAMRWPHYSLLALLVLLVLVVFLVGREIQKQAAAAMATATAVTEGTAVAGITVEAEDTRIAEATATAQFVATEGAATAQAYALQQTQNAAPTPTATPSSSPTPLGGSTVQIAFVSQRDGNREIYLIDEIGATLTNLTNNNAYDGYPTWSKDGQRIAFVSTRDGNREIYIMDIDGTKITRLTNNKSSDYTPAWSKDEERIAFTSDRDNNDEIYIMKIDGGNLIRLTNHGEADFEPAWSHDRKYIVFTSSRDNNFEIYKIELANRKLTRLTRNNVKDYTPAWSHDGQHIAFTSTRDGNDEIYVMDTDGKNVIRLTNHPGVDMEPDWSPDGQHIAFTSNRDGNYEIYIMDADGSNVTRLTNNDADDQGPAWSP